MARIEHLALIAGGVIVPRLSDLALAILFPDNQPSAEITLQAIALERKVVHGTLSPDAYCRTLLEVGGVAWPATKLAQAVCERLVPRPGMRSLLAELAPRLELRLVCDYPRDWWEPTMERHGGRHGLHQFFARKAIYYTAEEGAPADYAAFFDALVTAGVIKRRRTLWVDHHSPRTSAAIRAGLDAAIFVDAHRLKRDLGLWGLLPLS